MWKQRGSLVPLHRGDHDNNNDSRGGLRNDRDKWTHNDRAADL